MRPARRLTSANFFICGTAAISTSTATAPDLYPAAVVDSAEPAIVPPVATMTMRGLRGLGGRRQRAAQQPPQRRRSQSRRTRECRHDILQPFVTRSYCGLRGVRIAAERVRDVGDRPLRAHAVARVVERRRDDGDAELARRHGDDAAADAALGGQPGVIEPLAGVVVETGGRHHREHAGHLRRRPSPACR